MANRLRSPLAIREWERRGRPIPLPNTLKQRIVRDYGRRFGLRILIETGTFLGEMDFVLKDQFARIVTIELSPEFHTRAVGRLSGFRHIQCLHGDSGVLLPTLLEEIHEPCLFWLDAHYSAGRSAKAAVETPISLELDAALRHSVRHHVALIDDARLFDGTHDYPLLDAVEKTVKEVRPDMQFEVSDDIIRITPS